MAAWMRGVLVSAIISAGLWYGHSDPCGVIDMQQYTQKREIKRKSHGCNAHFEALILFLLHRQHAFTREKLIDRIHKLQDFAVVCGFDEMVPPIEYLDSILAALIRDGKIYSMQKRGERGTFEEHFVVLQFGAEALRDDVEVWMRQIYIE